MANVHVINDESLGGIEREYIEVDRKAEVGDLIVYHFEGESDGIARKVIEVTDEVARFDEYYDENDGTTVFGYAHEAYRVLEPTDIVHIDELVDAETGLRGIGRYRLVDRKAEVGEKVTLVNPACDYDEYPEINIGNIYEIMAEESDGYGTPVVAVKGDSFRMYHSEYHVLEQVESDANELIEVTESDASPQVIDMLANLSRRIVSLEKQLRDTQRNVETLAQDIEVAKYGQYEADVDEESQPHDVVNHPAHYNAGKYEVIDVITDVTEQLAKAGASGPECYAIGNVLKYVMRYRHKNGAEDLRKAKWYIDKAVEEMTKGAM